MIGALILGGLALFLALATAPAWRALAHAPAPRARCWRARSGEPACVAPAEFMRASHMKLLAEWRDRVVRDGVRTYTTATAARSG